MRGESGLRITFFFTYVYTTGILFISKYAWQSGIVSNVRLGQLILGWLTELNGADLWKSWRSIAVGDLAMSSLKAFSPNSRQPGLAYGCQKAVTVAQGVVRSHITYRRHQ